MPKTDGRKMETTKFIWLNGNLLKWDDAKVHVLTHALHYGSGAFEGIRAYPTDRGPAVFRLDRHVDRLFYSAECIAMKVPYTKEQISRAILDVVASNEIDACYIRPIVYYGYGVMGLNPRNAPVDVAIACWPWGAYLPHEAVDVKIVSCVRLSSRAVKADAKICGHYINSIMAALEIRNTEYHEGLLLDEHGYLAEGPGENLFLVKDGVLATPKLGRILAGITRDTVIRLASDCGLQVVEKDLLPADAYAADEAFFTGTAAEVTPVASIDGHKIGSGRVGPITRKLKNLYLDTVYGRSPQYREFLSYVCDRTGGRQDE